jgi:hypothetical protein
LVQAIVNGKSAFGSGGNSIRTRAARQSLGTGLLVRLGTHGAVPLLAPLYDGRE